jgi:putative transcriptional regulator
MKSAFDKIAAGLKDAIAFAEGRESKGTLIKPVDIKNTERNQNGRTGNR